jgi:methionyl-tRNA synthetase
MSERVLVTAGLPYANGSLHLGHLVEYCQADMYVRALKRLGTNAIYICASDTHGTPIEVNATRLGVRPEALVAKFREEQLRDFGRFDVAFDHFSSTHSDTNRAVVERVYAELRRRGAIEDREIDGNWCETDQRFLPDRFIKGICPRCGAADQYGDVCEVCGNTYSPTELKSPHCVLCGNTPVTRKSEHVFFRLSAKERVAFLRHFVDVGALQPDVANYVRNWLDGGLRDWCISRDGPYFGFAIPDRPGKFFYVWLDAPLGYVSSSVEWGEKNGVSFAELWQSEKTRVEHIIGKDIVYFHTLFWPALLEAVGYTLPSKVHVHGMLTVNGEKMSKSRGTFINASVFAEHIEPQALRYYYACKYTSESSDLDLSLEDFVLRVNGELVNKHANLFSRMSQFLSQKLDNRLGDLPFAADLAQGEPSGDGSMLDLAQRVVASARRAEDFYRARDFGQVVRELGSIADIGNEFMQSARPWEQLKTDAEAARTTCTFAANVCYALAMYLWPIVPRFAEAGARVLGSTIDRLDAKLLFRERRRPLGTFERMFERIDSKQTEAVVEVSRQQAALVKTETPAKVQATAPTPAKPASASAPSPSKELVSYEEFQKLELRVGTIVAAEPVPKSKKLLKLQVELGEATPRQVVAGIGAIYEAASLVGRRVVVVANLKPAKLMGVDSQGMVLAAGDGSELSLLTIDKPLASGTGIK